MRDTDNLARHEWVGLSARVERALDPGAVGLQGRVVDETQRTVVLERANGREAVVQKAGTSMLFTLPGGAATGLDLGALQYRPQDRVKRARTGARARRA